MTRIDERKLIENITVDQTHDFTTCRLAVWPLDSDDIGVAIRLTVLDFSLYSG